MELSDINLLDRDAFAKGVPHDWFTYLRANHPIFKHPEPDGPGFWVVTKYDDCLLYTSPSPRDRQKSRMPSSA